MIYLEKKSIVELPKATGSISDTLNVEDKVKNAPSINLVTQMTGIPQDGVIAVDSDSVPEGYVEIENPFLPPVVTATSDGLMSANDKAKLDALDMSGVITKTINLSMPTSNTWYDTGITGSSLQTGTYIVQMYCDFQGQGGIWMETYSGVMSWYSGGTNNGAANQIELHNAGHSPEDGKIMLRTLRQTSGGFLKLQIASARGFTVAKNVVLKFRRII